MADDQHELDTSDAADSHGTNSSNVPKVPETTSTCRRKLLQAVAGTGVVATAGCLGLFELPEEEQEPIEPEGDGDDAEDDTEEDDGDDAEDDTEEDDAAGAFYDVEYLDQDITVEVGEDEFILFPSLDAGVEIDYSCEQGVCGQCTAKYDGDANEVITHDGNQYLSDEQVEEGWLLTCVASPETDFAAEVAHPDG